MWIRAGHRRFDVDGICFDKDGTLIDLESYWLDASRTWVDEAGDGGYRDLLAVRLGLDDGGLVADGALATASIDELTRITAATLHSAGADDPAGRASRAAAQAETLAKAATPLPIGDVAGALQRLARAGLRLAVATTDDHSTAIRALELLDVADLVSIVLAGDGDGPFKPDPGVLALIAEQWQTVPGRILMVGDSKRDRETAINAQAAGFVLVADTPRIPADATVSSVDQIVPLATRGSS